MMHSDLFRLAAPLRARGIRMTLLSTGLLLAHYATRIVDSIDEVIVSLDGPREVHDAIRRVPGAFDRLVEGVRAIHHASARCTVQARNAAHLRATVAAARAIPSTRRFSRRGATPHRARNRRARKPARGKMLQNPPTAPPVLVRPARDPESSLPPRRAAEISALPLAQNPPHPTRHAIRQRDRRRSIPSREALPG